MATLWYSKRCAYNIRIVATLWRGREDLNLRGAFYTPYSLSRGAPSASWVLPQVDGKIQLAERVGFEPTDAFTSPVFKTGAFNHSAISPCVQKHIQLRRRTHFTTLRPGCQWISALRVKKVCRTTIHLGQLNKKGMRNRASCVKVKLPHQTF